MGTKVIPDEVYAELETAQWRKSGRSTNGGDCVEAAKLSGGHVAVRDSKNPGGAKLVFTRGEWEAFTGGVKDGEFDL